MKKEKEGNAKKKVILRPRNTRRKGRKTPFRGQRKRNGSGKIDLKKNLGKLKEGSELRGRALTAGGRDNAARESKNWSNSKEPGDR